MKILPLVTLLGVPTVAQLEQIICVAKISPLMLNSRSVRDFFPRMSFENAQQIKCHRDDIKGTGL